MNYCKKLSKVALPLEGIIRSVGISAVECSLETTSAALQDKRPMLLM